MGKYLVTLTRETHYITRISASSEDEAELKAWNKLEKSGTRYFKIEGSEWAEGAYVEEEESD